MPARCRIKYLTRYIFRKKQGIEKSTGRRENSKIEHADVLVSASLPRVLPQGLVQNNARGHGQIQTADIRVGHGQGIAAFMIKLQDLCRQSFGLFAEDKKIPRMKAGLGVGCRDLGGKEKKPGFRLGRQELIKIIPVSDINKLPVIKTSTLQVLVIRGKSQRSDQMENGMGRPAQSGDGTGVGWNLRLNQNDIKRKMSVHW